MPEVTVTAGCSSQGGSALVVQGLEKVFGGGKAFAPSGSKPAGSRGGAKGGFRGAAVIKALNGVDMTVDTGEFVAVMGPSGSGKSTLLNCIATIEKPTAGKVLVGGVDVAKLRGHALSTFRRDSLGFIFQDFNLIDTLTGYENIALALSIKGAPSREIPAKVQAIAAELGVSDVLDKFPSQMSGGQRQRTAAARAVVTDPKLVLADEPTGALDSRNARVMMETLSTMNKRMGTTIVMVTHDSFAASFADRVIFVSDGKVFNQVLRGEGGRGELFDRIMKVQAFLGGEARHDA